MAAALKVGRKGWMGCWMAGDAAKEAGIGASLDGKLERGCEWVGAGVDGEKNLERELEPRGCFGC